jgi:hypothetical protein
MTSLPQSKSNDKQNQKIYTKKNNEKKGGFLTTKKPDRTRQLFCSPERFEMGQKDNTCMSVQELKDIAKDYNNEIDNKSQTKQSLKEKSSKQKVKIVNDKKTLVKELQEKLGSSCGSADHCWVQQDFVTEETKQKILDKAFRPLKPKSWYVNRQTWLNTYDILKVMKQYEDKYNDFVFLGVFPIDFADNDEYGNCVAPTMCKFSIKKVLDKGKKRFGMVLNLDRHDESGSHWVALYCNLQPRNKNFGIYYYDSVAYPPTKEVATFMKQIEQDSYNVFTKKVADRFAMRYNKIQKQFSNYDCGVFSEVFLTQILKNIKFDDICRRMHTDDDINKLRDVLYTPSKL